MIGIVNSLENEKTTRRRSLCRFLIGLEDQAAGARVH
jgi:hypothetical protein